MTEILQQHDQLGRRILRLPEAILLDLDRCALDTNQAFKIAVDATAYNTPITAPQMMREYGRSKREHRSFNVVGWINHTLSELPGNYTWKDSVETDFVDRGRRQDLLMRDVDRVIDYAMQNELHLGIVTYGASSPDRADQKWIDARDWQLAKIAASRKLKALPHYVCNQRQKGSLIENWRQDGDGLWLPDELTAEEGTQTVVDYAVLLDDKTDSFRGMEPDTLSGIRITPEDEANQLEYQKGELPTGVVPVVGMTEALGALKAIIEMRRRTS